MGKKLGDEIVLRPRFTLQIDQEVCAVLEKFQQIKQKQDTVVVTQVDQHVFLKIPKAKQHYWSPQLELELYSYTPNQCTVKGLFGPKPAVWTLFMFLHFVVGILLLSFAIWTYANYKLESPIAVQLTLTALMIIAWFVLYAAGRMGKAAGKQEMYVLYHFMQKTIRN